MRTSSISTAAPASEPSHALRSFLVTFGPSSVLVLALAGATVATLVFAISPEITVWRAVAAAGLLGVLFQLLVLRPWYLRRGASDDEVGRELPGDRILVHPVACTTRAVTIAAPTESVWPWLVQMGRGRGGLYSYDWLENLAGLGIHSVARIVPELQRLTVGDRIPLGPGEHGGLRVANIVARHALVLRLDDLRRGGPVDHQQPKFADSTWAFVLEPVDAGHTRLIARFRIAGRPRRSVALLYSLLIEIPHYVMEWKMLAGIKRRAERARGEVIHG